MSGDPKNSLFNEHLREDYDPDDLNKTFSLRTLERTHLSVKNCNFLALVHDRIGDVDNFFARIKGFEVLIFILHFLEICHSAYVTASVHAFFSIYTKIVKEYNDFAKLSILDV